MYQDIDSLLQDLMERKNQTYGIEHLKRYLKDRKIKTAPVPIIHIGGTNGKGSTTNYIRAILEDQGYRVGTFTSPHLESHNDRIRINNQAIPDERLLAYINETVPDWDTYQLSMFEVDMIVSMRYFEEEKVDYIVYEVGLGGLLDATNVIDGDIILITNIDYDHMDILGSSLEEIALQKAGIFKSGAKILTTEVNPSVLAVFQKEAQKVQASLTQVLIPDYQIVDQDLCFTFAKHPLVLHKEAVYQVANASLALSAAVELLGQEGLDQYIRSVEETKWAGRFEELAENIYIDGAHNEIGIHRLVESLAVLPKPWTIVFTALRDKDYHSMIADLEKVADSLIITEFDFPRRETAENLALGHDVIVIKDYREAIQHGLDHKGSGSLIITGSLYFISLAREWLLDKEKALR